MERYIRIEEYGFQEKPMETALTTLLPKLVGKGIGITYEDYPGLISKYSSIKNLISFGPVSKDLVEKLKVEFSSDNENFYNIDLPRNRREFYTNLLFANGYMVAKYIANKCSFPEYEIKKYYQKAVNQEQIASDPISLGKFTISTIIWHEANHAARKDISMYAELLRFVFPFILVCYNCFYFLSKEIPMLVNEDDLVYVGECIIASVLLKFSGDFIAEYHASKAQSNIEAIIKLTKLIDFNGVVRD